MHLAMFRFGFTTVFTNKSEDLEAKKVEFAVISHVNKYQISSFNLLVKIYNSPIQAKTLEQ